MSKPVKADTAKSVSLPFEEALKKLEGIVEAVHLAEVAQSLPFLATSEALTPADLTALQKWFADYFDWLNTSRLAGLARDPRFREVHRLGIPGNITMGGDEIVVYETPWTRRRLKGT